MPDGFNPAQQLQKIMTLRDLIVACKERAPTVLERIDEMLNDHWDSMTNFERMALLNMIMDRGFGKPRQTMVINDPSEIMGSSEPDTVVYIPDNGRNNFDADTIEAEAVDVVEEQT